MAGGLPGGFSPRKRLSYVGGGWSRLLAGWLRDGAAAVVAAEGGGRYITMMLTSPPVCGSGAEAVLTTCPGVGGGHVIKVILLMHSS